jgi:hypothetical protein
VAVERDIGHLARQLRQGAATTSRRLPAAEVSMSKRRWPVLLGPPLILIAAMLLIARPEPAVEAARPIVVNPVSSCTSVDAVAGSRDAGPGSWWKSVERLDAGGVLLGRRLAVGRGSVTVAGLDLPAESSISGPVGGRIVVTADDGNRSTIRVISASAGCGLVIHETAAVVRTAILDRHDDSVLAHLVDRATRADLGTWRLAIAPAGATQARLVAPPLGNLARTVGTIWATGLRLDAAGTHLAVQSCADLGCLTRIFDLRHAASPPVVIRGVEEGPMLGFAGGALMTWAACPGYPCAILAWDPATGGSHVLIAGASAAAMTGDGRRLVALQADAAASRAVEIDPVSGHASRLRGLTPGIRPLGDSPAGTIGLEVAANEVVIGSAGSDPTAINPDALAEEVLP